MLGGVGEQGLRLPAARVVCTLLVAMVLSVLPAMAGPRLASAAACTAQAPNAFPNDPEYARAENDQSSGYTWDGEQWYLYGCLPQGVPLASDPEGASGMSVDRVWNDLGNRGRDDVKVAYMEGGINWRIGSSCELKDRAWLNTAELPHPQDAQGKTATELGQNGDPYDLNADGVVNVEDYLDDPRIPAAEVGMHRSPGDVNQPFLHQVCATTIPDNAGTNITPEDLIVTFGHCQVTNGNLGDCPAGGRFDNDGNGYPNDINGWNFNRDNNDPQTEQSVYGHFNGESGQLVGEADNGYAGAGMCPLCRYIPIKAGDEAIDRPDRVAEAIAYAADNGVNVMDVTDASVGLTPEMKAVIDYAYHKGMVIAWASNDFESADHTDGMYWPHVWPGNSVTGDQSTRGGATCPPQLSSNSLLCAFVKTNHTYRARSSLTSYGPHSLFSVPNTDGSTSTGTPTQAGVAALVVAEGLDAVDANQIAFPLDAEEVRQVVRSTASYIGPLPACPLCFQGISGASFNIQYGYGRPNVYRAAVAVDNGEIPPTADILSPDWYQLVDPTRQSTLHVTADVAARRATGYTWELQYGLGPEPLDSAWQTFASGAGTTAQSVGGDIDLSAIPASAWSGAYSVDPSSRLTIESYDVSVRAVVHADGDTGANPWK
ncbi:MAG: hypothetical protein QOE92_1798, partial [Chloroflexota bacterium]|nr:hypothetical protein [Chloroflexota bacterium]